MKEKKELKLEGVSKITFEINSIAVNKEKWGEETKFRDGVILRSLKKDSKNACNEQTIYVCELQCEKFMIASMEILKVLGELYDNDYCNINLPLMIGFEKRPMAKFFSEVLVIKEIRFFFDFANISAFSSKKLILSPLDEETAIRTASWILYDRRTKISQDSSEKENFPYPYRLEIRYIPDGFDFLDIFLSYYDFIIKEYRFHIAKFWKNYCSDLVISPDSKHPMLTLICQLLNEDSSNLEVN